MSMEMEGNRSGSDEIYEDAIFTKYMVAPQEMSMDMHMLGMMYAVNSKLTYILQKDFY